jgi:hypothetical protein
MIFYIIFILLIDSINYYISKDWGFTEFGQLIAEVNDGQNDQIYCLTKSIDNNKSKYVKMEICDLNKKEQIWKITLNADNSYNIQSSDNSFLKSYNNYYVYSSNNYPVN